MRKTVEQNERVKHGYVRYLEHAKGLDEASTDKVLDAIYRFEQSTGFKPFRAFHIDQAVKFKADLAKARNKLTGKPLSLSTVDTTLTLVRNFFAWLAGQQGFKSKISYNDIVYFRNSRKNARAAHADRDIPYPSIQAARHAFQAMPSETDVQKRNKALFAFLMLTGIRIGAAGSLRLKHINLFDQHVLQDAREVNTKAAKTIDTWFFPVDPCYLDCFTDWVEHLKDNLFFGPTDALFPKIQVGVGKTGGFEAQGLSRDPYATTTELNRVIRSAFAAVQMPTYTPHAFRKTLAMYGDQICETLEERKAWSRNLGHEHLATTVNAYMPLSRQRQAEIIKGMKSG